MRTRFDRYCSRSRWPRPPSVIVFAAPLVSWTYGEGFAGAVVPLVWTGIGLVPTLVNSGRKVYLYASGLEGGGGASGARSRSRCRRQRARR